ncbi:MAG: hypothetical protein WCX31_04960 [Salinivirgaceae bacterium]|jgi:hypothetical protein
MKKILVLVLLIELSFHLYSQEKVEHNRFSIKIPVTSCLFGDIMSQSAGAGLGFELQTAPNYSFNQDVLYLFHWSKKSNFISTPVNDISGIKLVSSLRRYFKPSEKQSGFFMSVDLLNMYTYSLQRSSDYEYYVKRYRPQLTVNSGFLVFNKPDKSGFLTFELYGGIGIGYVYAKTEYLNQLTGTEPQIPNDAYNESGFYHWFNVDFKMGFMLP